MEITTEKVQQRLKELEAQSEKLKADLNAVCGAIQDCEYWLSITQKPNNE